MVSRRVFLSAAAGGVASALVAPYAPAPRPHGITGSLMGPSAVVAHSVRDTFSAEPVRREKKGIVIVGGGIAGLSAAWRLKNRGFDDITLLELHSGVGGNSLSGTTPVSPHPWGAHYVPIPNRESALVRELFEECGVCTSGDGGSAPPLFNEKYLCAEPQERLFHHGKWQSGLLPHTFVSPSEKDQHARFTDLVREYQEKRGADGRPVFSIPVDLSSRDPEYLALDQIAFLQFVTSLGFSSPSLLWYLDYCCRDDYGAASNQVSAWAGLHYFASRRGWSGNCEPGHLLTWPEGNGWIVKYLRSTVSPFLRTGALVRRITPGARPVVLYLDTATGEHVELDSEAVIYAAPRFTAKYLFHNSADGNPHLRVPETLQYHPWMVANLSLREPPDGAYSDMAWDNVVYGSTSLGYVSALHQTPTPPGGPCVLTYYHPFPSSNYREMRKRLALKGWEDWRDEVLKDLSVPHPTITKRVESINVWLWGHGMASPAPNYIWRDALPHQAQSVQGVWFGHSDMSGISVFEEAQYRGVAAAESVMRHLKGVA